MHTIKSIILLFVPVMAAFLMLAGCEKSAQNTKPAMEAEKELELDKTVGALVEIIAFERVKVEGIGLVVGLSGTGSAQCPPNIRKYLTQYILKRLPRKSDITSDELINSRNTAVVHVQGMLEPAMLRSDLFDVKVTTLGGTQTTSLAGGQLYTSDLMVIPPYAGGLTSRALAQAAGAIFIDTTVAEKPDEKVGYVLGGGSALNDSQATLALFKPNFQMAATIRNRINERFKGNTATAKSSEIIHLSIPPQYLNRRERFFKLIKAMYIARNSKSEALRIEHLIGQLKTESDKDNIELALDAIGTSSIGALTDLLDFDDEAVRFAAARCLLNLRENKGLAPLRAIAQNENSPYRLKAIDAIGLNARRDHSISLMNRLIRQDNFDVMHAAAGHLRRLGDFTVTQSTVADNFYLDKIHQAGQKVIHATRTDKPRITLYQAPILCNRNVFVEFDEGNIIINAIADAEHLSVMRKHPVRGAVMGPVLCSFEVSDLIRALCENPVQKDQNIRPGLGASYSDIVGLLKKMCEKGAIDAKFVTSEPPRTQ